MYVANISKFSDTYTVNRKKGVSPKTQLQAFRYLHEIKDKSL